jgi:predicted TIM-barrel fold metal-dependent hydrolase
MKDNGISEVVALASYIDGFKITNEDLIELASTDDRIIPVGSIDPNPRKMGRLEEHLKKKQLRGVKIYSGYMQYGPNEPFLETIYELCERYNVPALFHTGDTLTSSGKLKHALPILIDEIATNHRRMKLVLCHFGNPWIMDAAELLYKNPNVLADLSGLVIGNDRKYTPKYIKSLRDSIKQAIAFIGKVEGKIVFGSDWPVCRIDRSLEFVRSLGLDRKEEALVLGVNTQKLFGA